MKKVNKNDSNIIFKLAKLMDQKGCSKNRLCVETGLRFETIQGYYNGAISRVDLHILPLLCETLKCNVQDIIEYKKWLKHLKFMIK